ncbi:hypothetical protein [Helicobacter pylori]|uniref:hypothetical protein n=1 Tax=Helicobacter pylori TaxID=210 RepID=UPI000FDD7670|nr:hypothetical protein [Helicobacter pylori]RVY22420.1 hypothetical protein ECC09_08070 [Helicobacter pylori]
MKQSAREKTGYCLYLIEQYKQKKGYKEWHRLHRELERMMGIVEFHFYDDNYEKKEILTFNSYQQMIDTLTEKLKQANTNQFQRDFFIGDIEAGKSKKQSKDD